MLDRSVQPLLALGSLLLCASLSGQPAPELHLTLTNGQKILTWQPYPAAEEYLIQSGPDLTQPLSNDWSGARVGFSWATTNDSPLGFYRLAVMPLSSNALLAATVLNRLAYGPTPDELERLAVIGPQAYLDEQLAPETVSSSFDSYRVVATNGVSLPPNSNWTTVTVTGVVSSSTLYMYLSRVGDVYLDDVQLRYRYVLTAVTNSAGVLTTNISTNLTGNLLVNGDFEQPPTNGWTVEANLASSQLSTDVVCSGVSSLHLIASAPGSSQSTAIWQGAPAAPVTTRGTNESTGEIFTNTVSNLRALLTFSYLPNAHSGDLTLRLSGSGTVISGADESGPPQWVYATATGTAATTPSLYIYLSGAGEGYLDDLKLVQGSVAEAGPNLLINGDFEQPFNAGWRASADFTNSYVDQTISYSGNGSLHLIATAAGGGANDSVFQTVAGLTNGQTYTLSYWYRPATRNRTLTVRLSGSLLTSTPDSEPRGLRRRLDAANRGVTLDELRRWFCGNAVGSPRQLVEILSQFLENHFVTYHAKTSDYFDRYYDGSIRERIATDLEYREMSRWRNALLNPNCTFYDLLKISAESPAQIIYLDTVASRGDGNRIANENYARELFELYCMGVDNGYDQLDITVMSRAWTGWTVDIVAPENLDNPLAPRSTQFGYYPGSGYNAVSNLVGVWTFTYNTTRHGTNRAPIFSVWDTNSPATNPAALGPKLIPARFGPPWAGQSYQLDLPPRTGTLGIQDGYDVIRHLSELPFTAEYVSIKLCRLFVHDEFPNPTTRPELPEYAFYDYTNPNRSAEAELVRRCLVAWDTPGLDGRKGHLRAVLRTIFDSELFRSHGGSRQKVKTPLEFVISSARALRSFNANGTATAFSDGNFTSPLSRMGQMSLFNRADPDGYPEDAAPWISAGTLAERLRFVQALCMDPGQSGGRPGDAGANTVDPVALLQRKVSPDLWSDAGAVADLFLSYFFLGEGRGNLDLYRASAISFLNDGRADPTSGTRTLIFNQLPVSTDANSAYDLRVRGMVAMLMTLQRFQEQ